MSAVRFGDVVHTYPTSSTSSTYVPQIKLSREVAEEVHATFPVVTASISQPIYSAQGVVVLHVYVNRSPLKAWADAWTTVDKDENSARVTVGSIRLRLDWVLFEDSVVQNASEHHQWEWASGPFTKAKATAWTTGPDLGPAHIETSI